MPLIIETMEGKTAFEKICTYYTVNNAIPINNMGKTRIDLFYATLAMFRPYNDGKNKDTLFTA